MNTSFFFRTVGVFVTVTLVLSPWVVTVDTADPFLNQGWITFGLACLAIAILAGILPGFRPRPGQIPAAPALLLLWGAIAFSTLAAPFPISLHQGLLFMAQLLLLLFLRLIWRRRDTKALLSLMVLSGSLMAVYAIFQRFGYDIFVWLDSPYSAVGTFTNPNFLAAYLLSTLLIALGFLIEAGEETHPGLRILFFSSIILQLIALSFTHCEGAWLVLLIGVALLLTDFWEIHPQNPLHPWNFANSPEKSVPSPALSPTPGDFVEFPPKTGAIPGIFGAYTPTLGYALHSGVMHLGIFFRRSFLPATFFLTLFLLGLYGCLSHAVSSFPWQTLSGPPYGYFTYISRLLEWHMGFSLFLQHPWAGIGPGGTRYLLSSFRPPLGTMLGLSPYNDDAHSTALTLASETGFFGLLGGCALLVIALGIHARLRHRSTASSLLLQGSLSDSAENQHNANQAQNAPQVSVLALNFSRVPSPRIAAVPALALILHGLFNNTLSILPLSNTLLLLGALHQGACLADVRWRSGFFPRYLLLLFIAPIFCLASWTLQRETQNIESLLWKGYGEVNRKSWRDAAQSFAQALEFDPQSLKGLWGMAIAQEGLGRLTRAQDLLARLDRVAPNVFGARYHLSRLLLERRQILEAHHWALLNFSCNQSPMSHELLGRILMSEGRIAEAEGFFREGLIYIPAWREDERLAADRMRLQLASLAIDGDRLPEAQTLLTAIGPPLSDSAETAYLRGLTAYKNGAASQAIVFFESACSRSPDDPRFQNALGFLLVETGGDLEKAGNLLDGAWKTYRSRVPPVLADVLNVSHSLGTLFWKQGKLDRAQDLLTTAFEECPLEWKETRERRARDLKRFLAETGRLSNHQGIGE
ncbi:MAG: O-antigen ligase family protein [Candidatus Ozemobacteraceae bacterium]